MTREYPPEVYGGAGVHVTELVAQLRHLCEVDVHCMGAPRQGAFVAAPDPALLGANPALSTLSADLTMVNAADGATVIHSHTWYTGLAGHLAALLYGAPHVLTALVCTGAAASLTAGSALTGQLRPGELTAAGWGWLVCIAVICTVAAVSLFFAGLERVRATTASILATLEPLVTVLLAFLVFGEMLSAVQLLGGAVLLGVVVVLTASPPSQPRLHPA